MVRFEHLGPALVLLRKRQGMTQKAVAEAAGMNSSRLSNYESNGKNLSARSLWRLLRALDCSFIDLEAALRFASGDQFPVRSKHWPVVIASEELPAPALLEGGNGRDGGPALNDLLYGDRSQLPEPERIVLSIVDLLFKLLRWLQLRKH
jgi:transcriptional regulator with XRE-family HTH domain